MGFRWGEGRGRRGVRKDVLVATATQLSGKWSRCSADMPFHHTSDRPRSAERPQGKRPRLSGCFFSSSASPSPATSPPPSSLAFALKSLQLNHVRFRPLSLLFIPSLSLPLSLSRAGLGGRQGTAENRRPDSRRCCIQVRQRCALKMQNVKDLIYSRAPGAQRLQLGISYFINS